ncbi:MULTISPECIES: cation:proton antiporter [unclassified Sinorhizobium]|uniref:cation:proton antiporter n=1 Tax=unclassified Sinorhizobium TaxID=2613772 RepID=UPI0024C2AFBA|nr:MULTISPECIES: cation:proton antiporter [unclassified Sinorhizobium]MDK1375598.1 cation:proton antiporter [Sinorhizobium sp. 6-70]MDK1479491.1 cation:proton antiporter [Sinorhizobium sp. 6-117]
MAETVLSAAIGFALVLLSAALLMTVLRIIRGPTLPDRVLGLDMLVAIAIGFIAVIAIKTGFNLYIDIAIALGLVGFLATVAFARFILARGLAPEQSAHAAPTKKTSPKRGKAAPPARRKRRGTR